MVDESSAPQSLLTCLYGWEDQEAFRVLSGYKMHPRSQALQRPFQARCAQGGSYTDAFLVTLALLKRFDVDMLTVQALGVLESRAGNTKAARELFRQSLAADPGHAYAWQVRPPFLEWMGIRQLSYVDQLLATQSPVTLQADKVHNHPCIVQQHFSMLSKHQRLSVRCTGGITM